MVAKSLKNHSFVFALLMLLVTPFVYASGVNITKNMPSAEATIDGKKIVIQRIQDQTHKLIGGFAQTSRQCPPFCIQPMKPAPGIEAVGELEVIEFMKSHAQNGTGLIVDARTPGWHKKGTIPSSVNIPFTIFEKPSHDTQLRKAMKMLGAKDKYSGSSTWNKFLTSLGLAEKDDSSFDYSEAKDIILWCNGMWCGQSPRAIKALLKHKYPAEKIKYYRGGMQVWQILGLSIEIP